MTQKEFDPITDKTAEIVEFIMQAPEMPQDDEFLFKTRLAVEEVVENVVMYAYKNGQGKLLAKVEVNDGSLQISISDEGVEFNPLQKEDPDITLPAEERQIGGLGIYLCKQMMDSVHYCYRNNCNVLTLKKRLP